MQTHKVTRQHLGEFSYWVQATHQNWLSCKIQGSYLQVQSAMGRHAPVVHFFLHLGCIFKAFSKLSWLQMCSNTTWVVLFILAINWNWKFINAGIPYFQISAFLLSILPPAVLNFLCKRQNADSCFGRRIWDTNPCFRVSNLWVDLMKSFTSADFVGFPSFVPLRHPCKQSGIKNVTAIF